MASNKKLFGNNLVFLLIASAIFLVGWTFAIPMFESPDERSHWQMAEYIHDHKSLPFYDQSIVEGNQGPVYYALIAPFAVKTVLPKLEVRIRNGRAEFVCFPRIWQICPSDMQRFWPMRWARIFSALLGVFGVLFVYLGALEASGNQWVALLAGVLIGFLPGFDFRTGNISNDGLLTVSSAVATYLIIRLWKRGFTWICASLASLAIAIAFLTKVNAIILLPGLVFVILSAKTAWPQRFKRLSVLLVWVAVTAPWLIRNKLLYGDFLASKAMLTAVPGLIVLKSITSPYFRTGFSTQVFKTAVGAFGGILDIYLSQEMYLAYLIVFILGLLGVIYLLVVRKIETLLVLLLSGLFLLAFASVVQLNLTISQPQGRYLYAALPAFMILIAIGWSALLGNKPRFVFLFSLVFAGGGLYALFAVEIPAYLQHGTEVTQTLDASVVVTAAEATVPGPLVAGGSFGQTFTATGDGLDKVEVVTANWGRKIERGALTLHLRESPSSTSDLASVDVPSDQIPNNLFVALNFKPIAQSSGKSYYFLMVQHGIPDATPMTVYVSRKDVYQGGGFYRDQQPVLGDMVFRTFNISDPKSCSICVQ